MQELQGAKNAFTCELQHKTITVNAVPGITSNVIRCRHKDPAGRECSGIAYSAQYATDQQQVATHEWYKPVSSDGMSQPDRQRWEQGGLTLREISK